jgi:hypothetical protein
MNLSRKEMKNKSNLAILISFLMIILTVLISEVLFTSSSGERIYPIYYSPIFLLYAFGYFYIILFSKNQPSIIQILLFFIFMKTIIFSIAMFDDINTVYMFGIGEDGDPTRVHIPRALSIESIDDVLYQLFSPDNDYNGRLTRVLIFINSKVIDFFGFDINILNIGKIMYLFNFILNLLTLYFLYKAAYIYSASVDFARRAMFFLAFNPFFIGYASAPRKEALLMFALSIFLIFIVSKKKNYIVFLLSIFLIALERIYMVPLLVGIVLYLNKNIFLGSVILLLGIIFVDGFIGIERAFSMLKNHGESITSIDGSFLGNNHGFFSNILRTLFGPAFFRPFYSEYFNGLLLGFVGAIVTLYFYIVAVKSLLNLKGTLSIIFSIYLYVFIFFPYQSTFKIMMLTMFVPLFLNQVSFVKYKSVV